MTTEPKAAPPAGSAKRRLHVVSAANGRYLPGLLVTFHSLLRHLAPGWAVDFTLLTDALDEPHLRSLRTVLESTGRDFTLAVVQPDFSEYEDCPALHGSKLTYARLSVPKLVTADRALYVDSDVVVTRDVSRLAALPWPEESVLYAARDARISTVSAAWEKIPWGELGIPASAPYFNAGFVWINLAAWRRQGIDDACRAYIQRFPDRLPWADQSVLNAVLWKRWRELEEAWNLAPERTLGPLEPYPLVRRKDVNVHYVGREKPWLEMSPFEYFYWDAAEEIIPLAPDAFPARTSIPRETMKRLRYFAYRGYLIYGSFCKRKLLKLFR